MSCKNNSCEYENKLERTARVSRLQKRYAQLWQEIELPKEMEKRKT